MGHPVFDSPFSIAKLMIAGYEIGRMLSSFDETLNDYGESTELYSHHENTTSFENMFKKDFKNLKYELDSWKPIFFEDTEILYVLVTKNNMDTSANKSVYEARTLRAEQYSSYKEGVFVLGGKSIYETIKRNKLSLYKNTKTFVISKTQKKV